MFSVWTEVCSGIGERGRDVYCVCVQCSILLSCTSIVWKCAGENDKSHRQVIIGIPLASGIPNLLDGPACVFPHNIGVRFADFT